MPKKKTKRKVKSVSKARAEAPRTAHDVTLADLLTTIAPPRKGTTGVHVTAVGGDAYIITVQGPEAGALAARVLNFIEALHDQSSK